MEQAELIMWVGDVLLFLMQAATLNIRDLLQHCRGCFPPVWKYRNSLQAWSEQDFSDKDPSDSGIT